MEGLTHAWSGLATAITCKQAKDQPSREPDHQAEAALHQAGEESLPISFLTWNVMGLTKKVKEELTQLVSEHSLDVMVFTETKLTERTQRKSWLRHALKDR